MTNKRFPEWMKTVYRGVRAGFSAGIVSAIAAIKILNLDLSKPKEVIELLTITAITAFGSGFAVAFGKWIREVLDKKFGYDEKSLVAKIMPI
jgi:hypothetical protein